MLEEGEEGLGSEENQPPIIIDAEVNIVQSSLIAWLVSTKSFTFIKDIKLALKKGSAYWQPLGDVDRNF